MFALVRSVPDTFAQALVRHPHAQPLDLSRARAQHRLYCEGLKWLGHELIELPALEAHPDSCFVEDTAIIASGTALVTRPGAEPRRGEVETIAAALATRLRVERMHAPATLDGGDCLLVGRRWYIGRSERTNAAGVQRAREVFGPLGYEIVEVAVERALHLKSVCSEVEGRVLLADGSVPRSTFVEQVILAPREEAAASNAVALNGRVLVADGFPQTTGLLEGVGLQIKPIDNSEFRRADGALTCLSLRF